MPGLFLSEKKKRTLEEILHPVPKKEDPRGPWFNGLDPTEVPTTKNPFPTLLVIIIIIILAIIAAGVFLSIAMPAPS